MFVSALLSVIIIGSLLALYLLVMLIMGIIGMVKDTNYATVCLCGASSLVMASNRLLRGNR